MSHCRSLSAQANASAEPTKPVVAFVELYEYDYEPMDFEISFAEYKVDYIQVRARATGLSGVTTGLWTFRYMRHVK